MQSGYTKNLRAFLRKNSIILSLVFFALFGTGVSLFAAAPDTEPYQPGETLDPTCIPGSSVNCTVRILPSQIGNAGKFLTTNGTTTSWASVLTSPSFSDVTLTGNTTFPSLSTAGGILYTDGSGVLAQSAAGIAGQAVISGGATGPTYFAPTLGSILFAGTSGILSENNSNFFWDNTNNRLGLGTNTPVTLLNIGTGTPTTASSGIQFGTDVLANLYRNDTGNIKTDGVLNVGDQLNVGNSLDLTGNLYSRGDLRLLNKAENGWISFATRNTAGPEALYDLSNIGTLFANQINSSGTISATLPSGSFGTIASFGANGAAGLINIGYEDGSGISSITGSGFGPFQVASSANNNIIINPGSGNVGIGAVSPTQKLEVNGNILVGGSNAYLYFRDEYNYIKNADGLPVDVKGHHGVRAYNDLGEVARFGTASDSLNSYFNGNVGIGSVTPSARLEVKSELNTDSVIAINTNSVDFDSYLSLQEAGVEKWKFRNQGDSGDKLRIGSATNPLAISVSQMGQISLGSTTASAWLYLPASTGAGQTAPLKFTAGTNIISPETGAVEYDGTQLFFTPASTRNILAQVSGSTALTSGSIPFATTSGYLTQDNSNFFWDDTNNRLGIGTASPATALDVNGVVKASFLRADYLNTTNNGATIIGNFTSENRIYDQAGTWLMTLKSGNVGIGTTNPGYRLDILGSSTSGVSASTQILGGTGTSAGGLRLGAWSASYGGFWSASVIPSSTNYALISNGADTALNTTSTGGIYINNSTQALGWNINGVSIGAAATSQGQLAVINQNNSRVALVVRATTSQTANLTQWQDNTGVVLARIASNGALSVGTTNTSDLYGDWGGAAEIPAGAANSSSNGGMSLFAGGTTPGTNKAGIYYYQGGTQWRSAAEVSNTTSGFGNLLLMKSGGNVGIGTTSPTARLNIVGNILGQSSLTDATAKDFSITTGHHTNSEESLAMISGISNATQNIIYLGGGSSSNNTATDVRFFTAANNTTTTGTERMRILSNGNVGIGTTNPGFPLEVASSGTNDTARFYGNSGTALVYVGVNGTLASVSGQYRIYANSGIPLTLGANGIHSQMFISTAGNVGIGTTSPVGKLDVSAGLGSQTAGDFVVDTANNIVYVGKLDSVSGNTNFIFRDRLGGVKSRWENAGSGSIGFSNFSNGFGVSIGPTISGSIGSIGTMLLVQNANAGSTNPTAIFRQGTTQTGDLMQWQNSAGTVLAEIDVNGSMINDSLFSLTHNATSRTAVEITKSNDDGILNIYRDGSIDTKIQGNGNSYFASLSGAFVGIGTSSPSYPLDVTVPTSGSFAQRITRNTAATTNFNSTNILVSRSTGDAADGFGGGSVYALSDNTVGDTFLGSVGAVRDGADNSGALVFNTYITGSFNERMRITSSGLVSIGVNSGIARLGVVNANAGGVAMIVRGAASQSANLVQFQDATGTVLSRVAADGSLLVREDYTTGAAVLMTFAGNRATYGIDSNSDFYIDTSAARGTAIKSGGVTTLYTSSNSTGNNITIGSNTSIAKFGVINSNASTVASVIRGTTSQSADLTQWQDNSATVLGAIKSSGAMVIGNSGAQIGSVPLSVVGSGTDAYIAMKPVGQSGFGFTFGTPSAQNSELWNYGTGFMRFATNNAEYMRIVSTGDVGVGTSTPLTVNGISVAGERVLNVNGSGGTRLAVQSASGSSLDFVNTGNSTNAKWALFQNLSNNFIIKSHTDAGSTRFTFLTADLTTGNLTVGNSGMAKTLSLQSDRANIIVRGSTDGGTGPFIDYDINSSSTAGTTFARISNGTLSGATSGTNIAVAMSPTFNPAAGTGVFRTLDINYTTNASGAQGGSMTGLRVNRNVQGGSTAFTTDMLADFQAGGLSQFSVRADGVVTIGSSGYLVTPTIFSGGGGTTAFGNRVLVGTTGTTTAQLETRAASATTVPLFVRGASSQTADLQQWQSSDSTRLLSVNSAGNIVMQATSDKYIYGGPASGNYINMYNSSTGRIHLKGLGTAGAQIEGALVVEGALSFNGNLSLASNSILGTSNSEIRLYDGSTGNIQLRAGTGSVGISQISFWTGTTPTERMKIDSSGNVGIGTTSPSARLQVNSTSSAVDPQVIDISTGGYASSTNHNGLVLQNSNTATNNNQQYAPSIVFSGNTWSTNSSTANNSKLRIAQTGGQTFAQGRSYLSFQNNENNGGWNTMMHLTPDTGLFVGGTNGMGNITSLNLTLGPKSSSGTIAQGSMIFMRIASNFNPTSGTANASNIDTTGLGFNPSSGNAEFNGYAYSMLISQTGSAAGITRGMYINPNLASAADFRAIEISNNSHYGIYQSGASAKNYFNGNVGIGTTSPAERFHVSGSDTSGSGIVALVENTATTGSPYATFRMKSSNTVYGQFFGGAVNDPYGIVNGITMTPGTSTQDIGFRTGNQVTGGGNGPSMIIKDSGNVGIGTKAPGYKLEVGSASVTGIVSRFVNSTGTCDINPTTTSLSCSSDQNLKKNITSLSDELLTKVISLRPVTYNWNSETTETVGHIGFIAQEVEQIFPDLVSTDSVSGLKSLNYIGFIPYITKAVIEQNIKVSLLEDRVKALEDKINGTNGLIGGIVSDVKDMVVSTLKVGTPEKRTGITIYDESTGDPFCIKVVNGNMQTVPGECAVVSAQTQTVLPENSQNQNINEELINDSSKNTDTAEKMITEDQTTDLTVEPIIEIPQTEEIATE